MIDLETLDVFYKIAKIVIAGANILLLYYIFSYNSDKNDSKNERDRKISLLKTLVLDNNLKYFYKFYKSIHSETERLLVSDLDDDSKTLIDSSIGDAFINLRIQFIDLLLAVDEHMYNSFIKKADELQEYFTNTIFDDGMNLSHKPKFKEMISDKISESKTEFLKILFDYNG